MLAYIHPEAFFGGGNHYLHSDIMWLDTLHPMLRRKPEHYPISSHLAGITAYVSP